MENFEEEISSIDEETSSLLNQESLSEKKSDDINGYDDSEDTRSELKFEKPMESEEESEKRLLIEDALTNPHINLKKWQSFATTPYGLVNDDLRRQIWPLLLEVDPTEDEKIPSLEELSSHPEYQQVVLDVNRSLKRFPPGIPYKQRVALQDQLTVLILRVIMKYPHLRYYQGYHDVAVTFLLVVGEVVGFRIMEKLSTNHLTECMEPTMEKTWYRLNYMYALLYKVDKDLHDYMDKASVDTMFALPWYLTWFGHSLNQYKDVVRLYDFFLASPPDMALYVAVSLVVQRRDEILSEPCDMASIHYLLSRIPDDLPFEILLERASTYFKKHPPKSLDGLVKKRVQKKLDERKREEQMIRNSRNRNQSLWIRINRSIPAWLLWSRKSQYGLLFAAVTVILGYIYYGKMTDNRFWFISYFNT